MMEWKIVGEYLGRAVKIGKYEAFEHIQDAHIETSVILVVFASHKISHEAKRELLKSLIINQPLAIMLFGRDAPLAFDTLIRELGDGQERKHVMTKLWTDDRLEAAIEDLLQATWPSEDRFGEWKEYAVLSVDGDESRIEALVKKYCD